LEKKKSIEIVHCRSEDEVAIVGVKIKLLTYSPKL